MGTKITESPFVCTQNMTRSLWLFPGMEVKSSGDRKWCTLVSNSKKKRKVADGAAASQGEQVGARRWEDTPAGGYGGGGLRQRLTDKSRPVSDLGAIKCTKHNHKSQDPQLKVQTNRLQEAAQPPTVDER